jgi:hypothetical protein
MPASEHVCEVAALDLQRRVHRELQALEDGLQQIAGAGVIVVGLLAIERVRCRPELEPGRREYPRRTLGLPALLVPRLLRLQPAGDHRLRGLDELFARSDLVDELHRLGLLATGPRAFQQIFEPSLRVDHAHDALRTAGAGKNPDLHLRERHLRRPVFGHDPPVRGECELCRTAHAGSMDADYERLAAGLQPPVEPRHARRLFEQLALRAQGVLLLLLAEDREEPMDHGDVGAAGKVLLAGLDDCALQGSVGSHHLNDRAEFVHHLRGEDIHRAVWHVPGDDRDAVGVGSDVEVLIGH